MNPAAAKLSTGRLARLSWLADDDHYRELIDGVLPAARVSVWIATANLKELRVEAPIGSVARAKGRYMSIVEVLRGLARRGVDVRILHGCAPSRPFVSALARHEAGRGIHRRMCPRVHMKMVAVDGRWLYLGSANFTGAGLGARSAGRRNFEVGVLTDDEYLLDQAQARLDAVWRGKECGSCKLRSECPKPIDQLSKAPPTSAATSGDGGPSGSAIGSIVSPTHSKRSAARSRKPTPAAKAPAKASRKPPAKRGAKAR